MIRLLTFLLLALLPGLAAAQRCELAHRARPSRRPARRWRRNPQWSDIVFGIQVDASNRSDQTLRSGLDQLAGVPGAELRTPLHYGAVGDGNHDDTAAVQAAIAAAAGATLYLGPGLYKITAALTSAAPVRIIGSSGGGGIYSGTCTAGLRIATANINLLTLSAPGSQVGKHLYRQQCDEHRRRRRHRAGRVQLDHHHYQPNQRLRSSALTSPAAAVRSRWPAWLPTTPFVRLTAPVPRPSALARCRPMAQRSIPSSSATKFTATTAPLASSCWTPAERCTPTTRPMPVATARRSFPVPTRRLSGTTSMAPTWATPAASTIC